MQQGYIKAESGNYLLVTQQSTKKRFKLVFRDQQSLLLNKYYYMKLASITSTSLIGD